MWETEGRDKVMTWANLQRDVLSQVLPTRVFMRLLEMQKKNAVANGKDNNPDLEKK